MTKAPTIGEMHHRLVLEYAQRKPDNAGGFTTTWLPLADVWARIDPVSGSEFFAAGGVKGRVTHDIRVRARKEIQLARRFRSGARIFDIHAVTPIGDGRAFSLCRCSERDL